MRGREREREREQKSAAREQHVNNMSMHICIIRFHKCARNVDNFFKSNIG